MKLHFGSGFFYPEPQGCGSKSGRFSFSPRPLHSQWFLKSTSVLPGAPQSAQVSFPGFCRISFNARVDLSFADMSVIRERGGDRERGERGGRARKGVSPPCARLPLFHVPSNRQVRTGNVSLLSLSLSAPHEVSFTQGLSIRSSHTSPSHPLLRWRWLKFVRTEFGARSETVTNPSSRDPARTPVSLCRSLSVKTGRRVRWNPTRGSEILKPAFPHNWMFGCCATEKKRQRKSFCTTKRFGAHLKHLS